MIFCADLFESVLVEWRGLVSKPEVWLIQREKEISQRFLWLSASNQMVNWEFGLFGPQTTNIVSVWSSSSRGAADCCLGHLHLARNIKTYVVLFRNITKLSQSPARSEKHFF